MMFHLKIKILNGDMDNEQLKYIENNIRYFIRAIKNSLAIDNYCVHLLSVMRPETQTVVTRDPMRYALPKVQNSEEIGNYYLIHYETNNDYNILENRILEIQENEVLGKYLTDNKSWKNIMLEIVE